MREEEMPAMVAPEGFQTHQCLVACLTPELARSFEAALGLPAGRFNGTAANGFAAPDSGAIVHARFMFVKIIDLPRHRFDGGLVRQSGQGFFELRGGRCTDL